MVNEVVAVGDASFQKKYLGKLKDIARCEGRAALLVSHNPSAIRKLRNTGILLRGRIVVSKNYIDQCIDTYSS